MENYEGELYLVFHFTGETWHPMINVYIPVKTASKIFHLLDDERVGSMDFEQFKEEANISEDEIEAFDFIAYLLRAQPERIVRITSALNAVENGEITLSEYMNEIS